MSSRSLSLPTIPNSLAGTSLNSHLDRDLRRGSRPLVDIIWNTTLVCPWDCAVCCVDAVHVTRRGSLVSIRSRGLELSEYLIFDGSRGTIYDQAAAKRQADGHELSLSEKLRVLDHLVGFTPKIDISGGDPLAVSENFELLKEASRRFGRDQITLTATGAGLAHYSVDQVGPLIGEFNFTYDGTRERPSDLRPAAYAAGNLAFARRYAASGVRTRAECPLSQQNVDPVLLEKIYMDLHDAGIDKLLIMRLFPSGRGCQTASAAPDATGYLEAIATLRALEAKYGSPRIKLQCALRHLDSSVAAANPCDMVRESFGLMADGTLLASPWAVGPKGQPLDDVWVLGNLAREPLATILASERVKRLLNRLDDNWGHCKLHAYVNGAHEDPIERILGATDPMYNNRSYEQAALQEAK